MSEHIPRRTVRQPTSNPNNELLRDVCLWLRSALDCKHWVWDVQQWNAADDCERRARESLRAVPETIEQPWMVAADRLLEKIAYVTGIEPERKALLAFMPSEGAAPTAETRSVADANGRCVQRRDMETYAVPIVGNRREWNIVTETGGRLERFEGTKRAADKRAAELHQQRPAPKACETNASQLAELVRTYIRTGDLKLPPEEQADLLKLMGPPSEKVATETRASQPDLEAVEKALEPFAYIGSLLSGREHVVPDETPMVELLGMGDLYGTLICEHFRAAKLAWSSLRVPEMVVGRTDDHQPNAEESSTHDLSDTGFDLGSSP